MNLRMYRQLCFILALGFGLLSARGQAHKWAFDIRNSTGIARINSQAVDDSSNIYIAGVFQGTMFLGTDTFTFASTTNFAIFYAKYDKNGNYIWGKAVTSAQSANLREIVINSKGQIILFGTYSANASSSVSFGSTTLNRSYAVFVAFLDVNGNFSSAKDLSYGSFTNAVDIALGPNNEIIAGMYINGFGSGWNIANGTGAVSGTGFIHTVAKFDSSASSLTWYKTYPLSSVPALNALDVDRTGQVFFTCRAGTNVSLFGKTTASTGHSSFIVWLDANGNEKKSILAYSLGGQPNNLSQMVVLDTHTIYLAGNTYGDSLKIDNSVIKSLSSSPNNSFNWVANLARFDTLQWRVSTSFQGSGTIGLNRLSVNGDFLYLSTIQNNSNFSFGGFSSTTYVPAIVSKLDRLGNVLWYLPVNTTIPPLLSGIENQDLVYSGGFTSTLTLSPFSLSNTGTAPRPFLARTFDYSITRGNVRSGPYCAGDTLFVPYLKVGEFDTSNVFTAEISDEEGEFLGRQRELGRLKTTRDSTITGFLPLFQVASSGKYRIRVTSSAPVVQSFFRLDTLNLLIYSRDKADPGPDTLICYGDTIQLNTFGGTRWNWSPAFAMSDSTARNPLIWPLTDTLYTIVISDSSGCGLADTADIRVRIRPLPQFTSGSQSDTLVCANQGVKLKNSFSGGLSRYYLTWQTENATLLKSTTTSAFEDSLEVFPTATTRYLAILTDSCASLRDTFFYTIRVFDTMQVSRSFSDTLLCINQNIRMAVEVSHPRKDSISYRWQELGNTPTLSTDSFYARTIDTTRLFQVTVNNSCNLESKDFLFTLQTHPPLENTIQAMNPRTFLCDGDSIRLVAIPQGGRLGDTLTSVWQMMGMQRVTDTLVLYADSLRSLYPLTDTFTLLNISSDGCSTPDDTAFYGFRLYPQLRLDSVSGLENRLCYIENQVLSITASGGLGFGAFAYQWVWNGQVLDTGRQFILSADSFPSGQNWSILAKVTDRCSRPDSTSLGFFIPDKPSIHVLGNDTSICSKESISWRSQRLGGDTLNLRYSWRINGSLVSLEDTVSAYFENFKLGQDSLLWLSVTLSDSCSPQVASDSIRIRIEPNPLLSFVGDSLSYRQYSDTTICRGESMLLAPQNFYTGLSAAPSLYRNGVLVTYSGAYALTNTDLIPEDSVVFLATANSNCGTHADTAIYVVYLRQPLSLVPLSDSLVCANTQVTFTAQASGGFGSNYTFTWLDGTKPIQNGPNLPIVADSFLRGQANTISLRVEDGCSLPESISFRLFIPTQPQVAIRANDTALCSGSTATWSSEAQGGRPLQYAYTWRLNGDSLSAATGITQYFENRKPGPDSLLWLALSLDDGCAVEVARDSILIRLKPDPVVSFRNDSLNFRQYNDTLICRGEVVNLRAKAFYNLFAQNAELYVNQSQVSNGGVYTIQNTELITADSILVQAINPTGCGVDRDTATYVIRLRQPLRLDQIPDTQVCAQSPIRFTGMASGGLPAQYRYTWLDRADNSVLSPSQSLNLASVDRNYALRLRLEDQCSSVPFNMDFELSPLDTLSTALSASALCSDTIVLLATAAGGRPISYQYQWTFNGSAVGGSQNSYTAYPDALSWVKVVLSDGCTGRNATDSVLLSEKIRFNLNFTADSVCEEFTELWTLQPVSQTPLDFSWREWNSTEWKALSEEARYDAGNYAFVFLAENSLGCRDSLIQVLTVKPKPVASFKWSPETLDQDNATALLSTELNGSAYTWSVDGTVVSLNQKAFSYQFPDSGNYLVKLLVDLNGCLDSTQNRVRVEEAFRYYEVTAFTPNGDIRNETFSPYVTGNIKEMRFEIFNTWGQKIFSGNQNMAWDGNYLGSPAPMGYYLVVMSVTTQDGRRRFEKSMVHLIR